MDEEIIKMKTPDIGQAMGSYLCKNRKALLMDAGDYNNGEKFLDMMLKEVPPVLNFTCIISHEHDDHIGGLIKILQTLKSPPELDEVYLPKPNNYKEEKRINELQKWIYIKEAIVNDRESYKLEEELTPEQKIEWRKELTKDFSKKPKEEQFKIIKTLIVNDCEDFALKKVSELTKNIYNSKISDIDFLRDMARSTDLKNNIVFKEKITQINKTGRYEIPVYDLGVADVCYVAKKDLVSKDIDKKVKKYASKDRETHDNNLITFFHTKNGQTICFPGDASYRAQFSFLKILRENPKVFDFKEGSFKAEVFIITHHGSENNQQQAFLELISPETAVAQAEKIVYGHPADFIPIVFDKWSEGKTVCLFAESVGDIYYNFENENTYVRTSNLIYRMNGFVENKVEPLKSMKDVLKEDFDLFIDEKIEKIEKEQENSLFNKTAFERKISELLKIQRNVHKNNFDFAIEDIEIREKVSEYLEKMESLHVLTEIGINTKDKESLKIFFEEGLIKKFENQEEIIEKFTAFHNKRIEHEEQNQEHIKK